MFVRNAFCFSIAQDGFFFFQEQPEQTNLFIYTLSIIIFTLYKIGEVLFRFISWGCFFVF